MLNRLCKAWGQLSSVFADDFVDEGAREGVLSHDPARAMGAHWQNVLSSPMDARRYVLEDWNSPAALSGDLLDRLNGSGARRVLS